ncbi:hypothetical protein [Flavobacterium sp.]
MNKSIKYGTGGALLFGTGNALLYAINQIDSNEEFDWSKFFEAFAKGAAVGGATGFSFGVFRDIKMTAVLQKTAGLSGYLNHKLRACEDVSSKDTLKKANKLREQLHKRFRTQLVEYPSLHGSAVKGLSIEGSDIDVQVAFKQNSGTIANVYDMVNDFCAEEFEDRSLTSVRSQKHSVGLSFKVADKDHRIDVVPLRQVNNGSGDTYLFVGNSSFFGTPTYKKTNPKKQLAAFKFTIKQKKIIKLLKVWKIENRISIKSMHLEYLVHKAFNSTKMPVGIDKCLLEVINYIGNNITTLRFVDPGNSNNIISNTLTELQKVNIRDYCFEMLDNIYKDERNIMDYFAVDIK